MYQGVFIQEYYYWKKIICTFKLLHNMSEFNKLKM